MKKIEDINECGQCPLRKKVQSDLWICTHPKNEGVIINYDIEYGTINNNCTLQDAWETCTRCGYEFIPTPTRDPADKKKIIGIIDPKTCPNKTCKSPYWNTPRKVRNGT